jgi:hypothetical protein
MRRLAGGPSLVPALGLVLATLVCGAGTARATGLNNFLAGINGLITAPAEPIMQAVQPPETLRELPGGAVVSHPVGLVSGTLMCVYQAMMGALDVALTPFWVMPTLSPEPRWQIVPGVEYE